MNPIDRVINFISPKWGAERQAYRTINDIQSNYSGAFPTRNSTPWSQSESLGGLPHLNLTVSRNLRDRARSLIENNPLASAILNRASENVVGNGFQHQATTADPEWNKRADELFTNWTHTADYYGRSWVSHQKLICNGLVRDGDIGGALLKSGQVQPIEGDYISSPYSKYTGFLHDGIELDNQGRIKQFWVMQWVDFKNRSWESVKPRDLLYVSNRRRVQQYRGETYFAQSFNLFDQIQGYLDAVVLAQRIAACHAVFITKDSPTSQVTSLRGSTGNNGPKPQRKIEPGMIDYLGPGEGIEQISPNQPGQNFDNNVRMLLRLLGLPFGLPLEMVLLDFSQTSYASAKASCLQAQRSFEGIQRLLIDEYYTKLYRWRISKFIKEGLLEEREDAFNHIWHPEPWCYLDAVKEIQASMLEVDAGLTTVRRSITARGRNADQIFAERALEIADMRTKHIPIYHTMLVGKEENTNPIILPQQSIISEQE